MDTGAVAGSKQREASMDLLDDPSTTDLLDAACWSARDLLELIGHVRAAKPRDGLRMLEDAVLDMVGRAGL